MRLNRTDIVFALSVAIVFLFSSSPAVQDGFHAEEVTPQPVVQEGSWRPVRDATSQVTLVEAADATELSIEVAHADGVRCPRSWRWVPELVETEKWGAVSPRCAEALKALS